MEMDRKEKLIELGAEALAEALLEVSVYSEGVDDLIERLIASPAEHAQRFQKQLAKLRQRTHFIDCAEWMRLCASWKAF